MISYQHYCVTAAVAVIGFESTAYSVEEGAGSLEVCVVLFEPQNGTSSVIIGNVKSVDKEATSKLVMIEPV